MKCNLFPLFFLLLLWGGGGEGEGDFGSGSGSKFNCAARVGSGRVGSDDLGYGPGSGFSFEPVQSSSMYANLIITKVHISSNCAVNSHIVFSGSFGIFALSSNGSLPKQ